MGGTSGVLLELMFRKMSTSLARSETITQTELCQAVQDGVDVVSLYGGATVGSRTMLDALVPMAQALVDSQDLQLAASKAREGADGTATMKSASAGRSNYLSEDTLSGTPDPGACAAAIVAEALCKVGATSVPN
jgi:dihydroxyacetone kinase